MAASVKGNGVISLLAESGARASPRVSGLSPAMLQNDQGPLWITPDVACKENAVRSPPVMRWTRSSGKVRTSSHALFTKGLNAFVQARGQPFGSRPKHTLVFGPASVVGPSIKGQALAEAACFTRDTIMDRDHVRKSPLASYTIRRGNFLKFLRVVVSPVAPTDVHL